MESGGGCGDAPFLLGVDGLIATRRLRSAPARLGGQRSWPCRAMASSALNPWKRTTPVAVGKDFHDIDPGVLPSVTRLPGCKALPGFPIAIQVPPGPGESAKSLRARRTHGYPQSGVPYPRSIEHEKIARGDQSRELGKRGVDERGPLRARARSRLSPRSDSGSCAIRSGGSSYSKSQFGAAQRSKMVACAAGPSPNRR